MRWYYMTGYDCVRESLEIFERSLGTGDGAIRTVTELARRAGYSVYHFTRLFQAVVGQTPKDYLSGRILSEAALALGGSDEPLAVVAARAGFPDYETFSRAVKKRFGLSPRRIRDNRVRPLGLVPKAEPEAPGRGPSPSPAEPEIASMGEHVLCGLPFFIEPGTRSFFAHWATFMRVENRVRGRGEPAVFTQFASWTDDEAAEGMSVLCALVVDPGTVQEPLFTERRVPAASYLRFIHEGSPSALSDTYAFIYRTWLAGSDTKPLGSWEFQRYPRGDQATEIYIPVALG